MKSEVVNEIIRIGQSIWYDNIERKLLNDGTLAGMVERGEIRGITSNPSIFNKAISQSDDYDQEIKSLINGDIQSEEVYEKLAIRDIQMAADLFAELYEESGRADGFVSLEVSPYLAHDTAKTIQEAVKIWNAVARTNLMVKIPATLEGLPAITEVISQGINVNVTLIFSLDRYHSVRNAYLEGLDKRSAAGEDISRVASVASFFISRIDSKVDQRLESLLDSSTPEIREKIQGLFGKTAVSSGKLAFADYEKTFSEDQRYLSLIEKGAKRQRALWASTSTKNPAYPDVIYVEELIGPDTVNTVPPDTLKKFFDHGIVARTIDQNLEDSYQVFRDLELVGLDMGDVTQELEDEGVKAFADAYTSLLESLENKMTGFKNPA
jgi:transaldolase